MKDIGIYIHIPFCKSKCHYCNFSSYANKDLIIDEYIDALCTQILQNAEILSQYNITSIYFGGGTPSYIESKHITKIMDILKLFIDDISSKEVTIEVNPNSITKQKMLEYKQSGINRVSIGLQSTHDDILKVIGRVHKYKDFLDTLSICKEVGIFNISIDLIYPLPNLTYEMFKNSLDKIINIKDEFNIKHISIYNLEVHDDTKIAFLINENYVTMVDEDEEYKMKELLENTLLDYGFNHYEISNYAINDYESKHNNTYWNQGEYLGFGSGASSFFSGSRFKNTDNIEVYIESIKNNMSPITEQVDLDKLELMKEYIILKLRLKNGISILEFKKKFESDLLSLFRTEISELVKQNLLIQDKNNFYLSKRGREVANIVWEKFI